MCCTCFYASNSHFLILFFLFVDQDNAKSAWAVIGVKTAVVKMAEGHQLIGM